MANAKKPEKKTPERAKVGDIEKIVVDLAKSGNSPAKIGLILKEQYGVPKAKILGKKITQILKENNIKFQTDLDFVEKKIKKMEKHQEKNKQDKRTKREIVRYISLKRSLKKYTAKKEAKDVSNN